MSAVRLEGIKKRYGSTVAVDAVDLDIRDGELFFLLGPSGCGKTTILRMIAGFIEPTAGRIYFGDRDVTRTPPNKRNTGMVFQSYALWPHMTVFDNVAYGLGVRKIARDERRDRTQAALRMVQMEEYGSRRPTELSGGQQQRVALARALVVKPELLLLDEPLSNLDARLRLEMREQIRRICSETGITTIYVTHDQKEALSLADRMAVMRRASVVQTGSPHEVYARPRSRFVAHFLGETNFINAEVTRAEGGRVVLETPIGRFESTAFDATTPRAGSVTCSIRPESVRILDAAANDQPNAFTGTCTRSVFLGDMAQHVVELDDESTIRVLEINPLARPKRTDTIHLAVDPDEVVILPD